MFDVETQVISISTETGKLKHLTSFEVSSGGFRKPPKGWTEKLMVAGVGSSQRFVHDPVENRLLFVISSPLKFVSLNLSDNSLSTILDDSILGNQTSMHWTADPERRIRNADP